MPANTLTAEKYVVYAVNSSSDDSVSDDNSCSINFRDSEYVDLMEKKAQTGNGVLLTGNGILASSSPAPSISTIDKWGSYWSKRERCCCFCNFLLTVTVAIMITIVVLATKGIMELRQSPAGSDKSRQQLSSVYQVVTVPCTTPAQKKQVCLDDECVRLSVGVLSRANLSADPCKDFYTYACGGYVAKTKVSWTRPRQRTNPDEMLLKYIRNATDLLAEGTQETDSTGVRIWKRLFQACIEFRDSAQQVKDVVADIGGLGFPGGFGTADPDLTSILQKVTTLYGVSPLFKVIVTPGGKLGIINRFSDGMVEDLRTTDILRSFRFLRPSDYIYRNEDTDMVLQEYKTYMGNCIAYITGVNDTVKSEDEFVSMVDDLYHLDVFVNRVMYSEDTTNLSDGISRCSSPQTVADLQHTYNYNISWAVLLSAILHDSPFVHNYSICFVALTSSLNDVLSEFSYTTIRRYLVYSALLQSDIFDVLPRDMPIFPLDRWSQSALYLAPRVTGTSDTRCVEQISRHIPIYHLVKHRISITSNVILGRLFTDLIASLEEIINSMYWIPSAQQKHLLDALSALTVSFEWANSANDVERTFHNVTEGHFANVKLLIQYSVSEYFKGRNVYTHLEAHSVLNRVSNNMALPVSSLQPPLLYTDKQPSAFYGGYGTFVAQTISETFDTDALLRFLTEDKIDHRVALTIAYRLQCLVEGYSKFELLSDEGHTHKIRGDLTKSANFKDSLALRVVHKAYSQSNRGETTRNLPGLELTPDQLFFVTYAQTMCEKTNTRGLYRYYIDRETAHHPPGKYRVIGTVANFKPFADAFQCPVGSEMNPQDKCTLF